MSRFVLWRMLAGEAEEQEMNLLCKFGRHDYVEVVVLQQEYSTLWGHRCSRCNKLPPEQAFLEGGEANSTVDSSS